MREFFIQELKTLEFKTGLKQYDRLCERDTYQEDLNTLLDELCRVCRQFAFIPEKDQRELIKQNMITDQEFTGFNARIIYKWLASAKNLYFKEQARVDTKAPTGYKIVEGEDRSQWLDKWLSVLGDGMNAVPKISPEEAKREGKIDKIERVATKHPSAPIEVIEKKELHIQYVRENYDVYTGKPNATWIPESEWLEKLKAKEGL